MLPLPPAIQELVSNLSGGKGKGPYAPPSRCLGGGGSGRSALQGALRRCSTTGPQSAMGLVRNSGRKWAIKARTLTRSGASGSMGRSTIRNSSNHPDTSKPIMTSTCSPIMLATGEPTAQAADHRTACRLTLRGAMSWLVSRASAPRRWWEKESTIKATTVFSNLARHDGMRSEASDGHRVSSPPPESTTETLHTACCVCDREPCFAVRPPEFRKLGATTWAARRTGAGMGLFGASMGLMS